MRRETASCPSNGSAPPSLSDLPDQQGALMPLVRIDVQEGRSPAALRKIADVVQDVMLDVFAPPPRDRYQIITEHSVGHIIAEDTGLGFERTDGVVVIQIFQQGRSAEQKSAAFAALASRLGRGWG